MSDLYVPVGYNPRAHNVKSNTPIIGVAIIISFLYFSPAGWMYSG